MNFTSQDPEDLIADLQQQIDLLREVVSRVQNLNNVSVGQTLPVRVRSGTAVPPVSNVAVTKSGAILGQTKLVVTWTEPPDKSEVSRYIIYVLGLVTGQVQEIQVASAHTSPAVFNILPDLQSTVVILVQTILKNGQSLNIPDCPTASIVTNSSATVGVGTIAPLGSIHIVTPNGANSNFVGIVDQHSTADSGADQYLFFKTRGTPSAPSAVLSGDALGVLTFGGYDGTVLPGSGETGGARLIGSATQNWTSTAHGTKLSVTTTPNGSTSGSIRLTIDNDGNMGLGGADFGGGKGVFEIHNAATVPSGDPPTGGILYVEAGALKFHGSAGTITTIAPA